MMPPRVLLLGDSIRMSYQPQVKVSLEHSGEAEVVGPAENCQYSAYTLERLPIWIQELGAPDVVHWNSGLHDVGHNPNREPVQYPVDAYAANLESIIDVLRETGARIVFALSTPVHPDRPFNAESWAWRNDEIDRINDAAREIMSANSIPMNDLHSLIAADHDGLLAEDQLHLSAAGVKACSVAVVDAVREEMALIGAD